MELHMLRKLTAIITVCLLIVTAIPCAAFAEVEAEAQAGSQTEEQTASESGNSDAVQSEDDASADGGQTTDGSTENAGDAKAEQNAKADKTVSVSFKLSIKTETEETIWIEENKWELEEGTKADKLICKALEEKNFRTEWTDEKKVGAISSPEGKRLENSQEYSWNITRQGRLVTEKPEALELHDSDKIELIYSSEDGITDTDEMTTADDTVYTTASAGQINNASGGSATALISSNEKSGWAVGCEFNILGLARDEKITDAYTEAYCENLVNMLNKKKTAQLGTTMSSDNSKAVIALTAMGIDPTDVNGYNLLEPLADLPFVLKQGVNGPVWALLAFDSYNYEIPVIDDPERQVTRQGLVKLLLNVRKSDGGWAYSGKTSDIDMTAMVIQALAPYYGKEGCEDVTKAVDEAIDLLSSMQNDDGSFSSYGYSNAESISQVIVALSAMGIDCDRDPRFIKNGKSAMDALLTFYSGNGFKHIQTNAIVNGLATTQGYYALVAYDRYQKGKTGLYDMSDISGLSKTEAKGNKSDGGKEEKKKDKKGADAKATGGTKSLGLLKVSGDNSKEAQGVADSIAKAVNDGSYNTILDVFREYTELSEAEQLAVRKNKGWKKYEKLTEQFGKENHQDSNSGIDVSDTGSEILPWYVRIVVKESKADGSHAQTIKDKLGENSEILKACDISFTDTMNICNWDPEGVITLSIPAHEKGSFSNLVVFHITDKGKIEFLKGENKDGKITVSATDFSVYGIAGSNNEIDSLIENEENNVLPWILGAVAALAAISLVVLLRRRQERK